MMNFRSMMMMMMMMMCFCSYSWSSSFSNKDDERWQTRICLSIYFITCTHNNVYLLKKVSLLNVLF